MVEAMLFLLGFSSVVGVYEIARTGKSTKSNGAKRAVEKIGKMK